MTGQLTLDERRALVRIAAREARAQGAARLRLLQFITFSIAAFSAWALWRNWRLAWPLWASLTIAFFVVFFAVVMGALLWGFRAAVDTYVVSFFEGFLSPAEGQSILRTAAGSAVFFAGSRVGASGSVHTLTPAEVDYDPGRHALALHLLDTTAHGSVRTETFALDSRVTRQDVDAALARLAR